MDKHKRKQNGITLISLVISIIVMLILAGVSINAVVSENGVLTQARNATFLQSVGFLQEYLQMEYAEYNQEASNYDTQLELIRAKHPEWFYQNAQGYILDSDGHVLYLIKKSGLPEEIRAQIRGGDATRVSQYYRQQDVYGVTSDLQVYYCSDGTDTILGLTVEDLQKDNPLEIAYDEDSLLSKVINGTNAEGKANEALSVQDLKSIKMLTIDSIEKLALLTEFKELPTLQTVYFNGITIPNLEGIQYAKSITEVRFTNCAVSDYSALCGLTNLNKLYLIKPTGKNADVATLCSSDKGIATAEFSNLRYFGIVGNGTYLQSTSKSYSTDKYDITDISGLANFSTTTKQAIQYMYLQNLQLTSIASLSDFINITIIRLEANALTTLEGIQNMSKLTYLIAPACYSNATSSHTLGSAETETQNTSTDALSYIYKNEEGKNATLHYVDLREARNLKWTSYLSSCSAIKYLYLTNNTAIKDIKTIDTVIGNCGLNVSVPVEFVLDIKDATVLDFYNLNITDEQLLQFKNNTNAIKVRLIGNPNLSNDVINEVLGSMTNLKYVSLQGLTNLTTIDFAANTTNLVELDLRNTGVIDLEILETQYVSGKLQNLNTLAISNANIDLTKIQKVISGVGNKSGDANQWCGQWSYGLTITTKDLMLKLQDCTEITTLNFLGENYTTYLGGTTVDLSNCKKLTKIKVSSNRVYYILPNSITDVSLKYMYDTGIDVSNCANITSITTSFGGLNTTAFNKMCEQLESNTSLRTLFLQGIEDCSSIEKLKNTGITMLTISGASDGTTWVKTTNNIEGVGKINSLNNVSISHLKSGTKVDTLAELTNVSKLSLSDTDVSDISFLENYSALEHLEIHNNKISNIYPISNLTNLTYLNLNNNNINDVSALKKLKKLESLSLTNNALYDNSYDSTGKSYYTLTVFSDLNQNQEGSLKNLYLSGNNIEDFSMLEDSNLEWENKTGW